MTGFGGRRCPKVYCEVVATDSNEDRSPLTYAGYIRICRAIPRNSTSGVPGSRKQQYYVTRPVRGTTCFDRSGTPMVRHSTAPVRMEKWWRTVDQHDARLNILLQKRRDNVAAERFFKRLCASDVEEPRKIAPDQPHSNPAGKAEIPKLANAKHVFVKAAARLNKRAEDSHQPTRERERSLRGFRDLTGTQKFLSCFGPIRKDSPLKRHPLRASLCRKQLAARFVAGSEFAECAQNPSTSFLWSLRPPSYRLTLCKLTPIRGGSTWSIPRYRRTTSARRIQQCRVA